MEQWDSPPKPKNPIPSIGESKFSSPQIYLNAPPTNPKYFKINI